MTSGTDQVRVQQRSGVLHIELNRPEAINALNAAMIAAIGSALTRAEQDDSVRAVLFSGAGDRGFCAGGDVRSLAVAVQSGQRSAPREYFAAEYALNLRIAEFRKPTIAWMHGACMGGGVGLAGHSRIRLVTDSSRVAMPETKIGFTPDVGGSWLLGRAPGRLGERLGLHGQVMAAAEAIAAGFADHYVAEPARDDLFEALFEPGLRVEDIPDLLSELVRPTAPPDFGLREGEIDEIYSGSSAASIIAALAGRFPDAAAELERLSPTALEVTLRSVRSARSLTLAEALEQEQRLAEWFFTERTDSVEGIRALLIDKDHAPVWPPLAERFPI